MILKPEKWIIQKRKNPLSEFNFKCNKKEGGKTKALKEGFIIFRKKCGYCKRVVLIVILPFIISKTASFIAVAS